MRTDYLSWLKERGVPLFFEGGAYWSLYQGAAVPAMPYPTYHELDSTQTHSLLRKAGAWMVRYSSSPCAYETSWWFIVCGHYNPASINAKTRQNVRRGKRECVVEELDTKWLSSHGYQCYTSAFSRYAKKKPVTETFFREMLLATSSGPFSHWGVFHGKHLAGFCQCITDGSQISMNLTKYDPAYLRFRSAYALIDKLVQNYVVDRGVNLSNGNRSIAHNTNYQDVLLGLGFHKQFCKLNIVYNPLLKFGVEALYPLIPLIKRLPDVRYVPKLKALLLQEQIRRESIAIRM